MDSLVSIEDIVSIILAFLVICLGFKKDLKNMFLLRFEKMHVDNVLALITCVVWFAIFALYLVNN